MGFVPNQFSLENFQNHLLKTLKVICQENIQRTDTLEVDLVGTPVGPVEVELEIVDFEATVFEDKVFNIWTLDVTVTDAEGTEFVVTDVPFREDAVHCPVDLTQWPGQVVVQKHDVEGPIVVGPVDLPEGADPTITFELLIRYCLVVAKEVLVKVNGAIPFC